MKKRVTLKVFGLVQGTGYRYTTRRAAHQRGLVGYVTNLDDGTVEIVAEGPVDDLKLFVEWCYNGVGAAVVQKVEPSWSVATGQFNDFVIKF